MDLIVMIDGLFEIGVLIATAIVGMGAALSLPELLPHVGDAKDARSALHVETY
jgi:type II secretory pathway pseudopilin PulG